MPPLDERYVRNLQDFNKALENIVELLQKDTKKKNVDSINKLLPNMDGDLKSVIKNMEVVLKTTKKIESQNDKILEEVKSARKAKETGMFANVADVDNKKKILDAIKVITLIAAGVLAIGLAFKLIAPVNFLSIIAIGLSIVFITGAFVMVAAVTEGMTPGDAAITSGLMIIMAMGITVSSWALALAVTLTFGKAMSIIFTATALGTALVLMVKAVQIAKLEPKDYLKLALLPVVLPVIAIGLAISSLILAKVVPMTFGQVMTTIFVAAAVGTSLYLMTQALNKVKLQPKHLWQFSMLAVILPAMAVGLVLSSIILKGIMTLSFGQMVSAIFTAVTIGVLVYLMKPLIEKMKNINGDDVLMVGVLIVILAGGLVVASWILGALRLFSFKEAISVVLTSAAIGLSILTLIPAIYILKSINKDDMWTVAVNIIIAAGAIMVSSWLLAFGTYDNVPDWEWAFGAGLTITAFAGTIWLIKKMGIGPKEFFTGGLTIIGISGVILLTSSILNLGTYDDYPSIGWALGVGLSLVAFGGAMMVLGLILTSTGGFAAALFVGVLATIGVAATMVVISLILNDGEYNEYPNFNWAMGVGLSLIVFGGAMMVLGGLIIVTGGLAAGALLIGAVAARFVASTIVELSHILGLGSYDNYPDIDWAKGVGLSMITFGISMLLLGSIGLFGFPAMAIGAFAMILIAYTVVNISQILSEGDYTGGPSIDWALGTGSLLMVVGTTSIMFAALLPYIWLGSIAMRMVANTIVDVANILSSGDFTSGPDKEWALGVGGSIKAFAEGIAALSSAGGGLFGWIFGSDQSDQITKIAQAMVDASFILKSGQWTSYPPSEWSKGVGNSILTFAKGIAALDEADIDPGFEFILTVSMLSWGLIEAAKILNLFDWDNITNYPSDKWTKGVGNAINAFAKPLANLGKYDVTGNDITKSIKRLSKGLVEAAEIIGEYENWATVSYPTEKWTTGVGNALNKFVEALVSIEKNDVGGGDFKVLKSTIKAMKTAAEDFAEVKDIVWTKYPTDKWSKGVGDAIGTFVKYLAEIEKNDIGKNEVKNLNRVVNSMIDAAKDFNRLEDGIWTKGGVFDSFIDSLNKLTNSLPTVESVEGFKLLGDVLSNISTKGLTTGYSIHMLSLAMAELGDTLSNIDFESMDNLSKFSSGMLVLSLIDDKKLEEALSIIDKKRNDIKSMLSDNTTIKTKETISGEANIEGTVTTEITGKESFYTELLTRVKSLDENVIKIANKEPGQLLQTEEKSDPKKAQKFSSAK